MDITHVFKAAVMTIKLQRKAELDKNRILPNATKKQSDEFNKQAKDLCQKITTLRNFLVENRTAYMRIGQHLKRAAQMTDEQRDLIDKESEMLIKKLCTQNLSQMRNDWKGTKRKPQQQEHMDAVLELLSKYLQSIEQIFVFQKKYRLQYELETYQLLKLASDKKKIPERPGGNKTLKKPSSDTNLNKNINNADEEDSDIDMSDGWQFEERKHKQKKLNAQQQHEKRNSYDSSSQTKVQQQLSQKVALDEDIQKSQQLVDEEEAEAAKELSPEDIQMFEVENSQLYIELQGLSHEVDIIEKNVVEIAQLQDIFTEKVSLQQSNIDRIANAVIGSTENVKDANEQIKQAIQRNAGLRVWSLFFLLVMSFSLLFLDWYYD